MFGDYRHTVNFESFHRRGLAGLIDDIGLSDSLAFTVFKVPSTPDAYSLQPSQMSCYPITSESGESSVDGFGE
jgi:hypothetical protein